MFTTTNPPHQSFLWEVMIPKLMWWQHAGAPQRGPHHMVPLAVPVKKKKRVPLSLAQQTFNEYDKNQTRLRTRILNMRQAGQIIDIQL